MGWASGSEIAGDVWDLVEHWIPKADHKAVARGLIRIFEAHDCDTIEECEQLVKAAKLEKKYDLDT